MRNEPHTLNAGGNKSEILDLFSKRNVAPNRVATDAKHKKEPMTNTPKQPDVKPILCPDCGRRSWSKPITAAPTMPPPEEPATRDVRLLREILEIFRQKDELQTVLMKLVRPEMTDDEVLEWTATFTDPRNNLGQTVASLVMDARRALDIGGIRLESLVPGAKSRWARNPGNAAASIRLAHP